MDVNVPGVMAIVVAPVAAQLSVLLVPEFMVVGFAVKEVTVGMDPFPDELCEVEPQPTSPMQANRMTARAQRSRRESLSPRELSLFLRDELVESMRECLRNHAQQTQCIAQAAVAVALRRRSPLDHFVGS